MAKRRRRPRDLAKERRWRRVIARWEKSGQTIVAFCERSDVRMSTFQWWRRELARRDGRPGVLRKSPRGAASTREAVRGGGRSLAPFVAVRLSPGSSGPAPQDTIEIELPGDRLVRVGPRVPHESLAMVLDCLEDR